MTETVVENTQGTEDKTEEAQTKTIDDLFEDKPKEGEAKVETEETETKAEEAKETETKEAETTTAEEKVPVKALTEERRKRQEAEKRANELEEKLKKTAPEAQKIPDPVEDPEGYATFMENKTNLDALRTKVSLSRDMMLDLKEDYAEKEVVFVELAKKNQFLVQQMNASPNPAKFAYQTAVEHMETEKLRDPKYKETLKEELRKEILAELEKPEGKKKKSALEVPDLTQVTAAGKNSDKSVKEDTLDDIMSDAPVDKGRKK